MRHPSRWPSSGCARISAGSRAAYALGALLLVLEALPLSARAQSVALGQTDPICEGRRIIAVDVHTTPADAPRLPATLQFLTAAQDAVSSTTRPEVVKKFIDITPGDTCNTERLAEAERVLRAQRIFQRVEVRAVEAPGGVRVDVDTQDDVNLAFAPYVQGAAPQMRGGKIGMLNLAGSARVAEFEWRDGAGYQDAMGVRYVDRLFGGRPQELQLQARRTLDGYDLHAAMARPLYTDQQRVAYIVSADRSLGYAPLRRPDDDVLSVPVAQSAFTIGATRRTAGVLGERIVGFTLATATLNATGAALRPSALGFVADSGAPLATNFRVQRVARVNLLAGLDRTRFVLVKGFDALTAVQDVRVGSQWSVQFGQSVPVASLRDRDQFVAVDGYMGAGGARAFGALQLRGEARRDLRTNRWDGQVVSGRSALYLKPRAGLTTVFSADASAGFRVQSPFQLSFADIDGGLLGYRSSSLSGARRAIVQAEQRMALPRSFAPSWMPLDLGLAVFAQAGRLWRDDFVPYAVSTPWQPVLGVGLLASPPQARRTWRVDVGLPLNRIAQTSMPRSVEFRVTVTDRTRLFWREPRDVAAGRESTHPSGLVSWP